MLWKAQKLPPSSKIFGISPPSPAPEATCTSDHLPKRVRAASERPPENSSDPSRKPPPPGTDPGRLSSTSIAHGTMESARRRPPAFADSPPPKTTLWADPVHGIRVPREATPVDRGPRRRGPEAVRVSAPQRARNPPEEMRNGRLGRNRPRRFLFANLGRLFSLPPMIPPSTSSLSQRSCPPAGSAIFGGHLPTLRMLRIGHIPRAENPKADAWMVAASFRVAQSNGPFPRGPVRVC